MEPKELQQLIKEDKQRRLKEFNALLQKASEQLNVEVKAVIEVSSSGESAIAKLVMVAR